MDVRFWAGLVVVLVAGTPARAEESDKASEAPPLPPFRRGVTFEGVIGTYAPTGPLKKISAPGPWIRLAVGYDFTKWFQAFVSGDAAFLTTDRAPPPPGPRAYSFYGFSGGLRFALPIGRVRVPLRAEIGVHEANDYGVLGAYGFDFVHGLSLGWAVSTGLEIRAKSRHYGIGFEVGIRNDTSFAKSGSGGPYAFQGGLLVHYTL